MRLWIRWLREKRNTFLLYAATVFLFLIIGCLYHMENLDRLLYAALLTLAAWGAAGIWGGRKYVCRSRRLEEAAGHYAQSGELILEDSDDGGSPEDGNGMMVSAKSLEEAQRCFLRYVCGQREKDRLNREERAAESGDYYLMWTHQIKTPISALRLLLGKPDLHGKDVFQAKEELFKIEQYVEMALTFQRLESISSDLVLQEHGISDLMKQAVKKYAVLFINKGLGVRLEETDLRIVTDEKWFTFCLEQLLSNSIKYTSRGGITLRAEASEEKVRLFMEDTGIGIPAEDLPRIFERGFTGYNGRLDRRSTGIGLYLCRRIFGHLGIGIKVESEDGKGTRVILGIPRKGEEYRD